MFFVTQGHYLTIGGECEYLVFSWTREDGVQREGNEEVLYAMSAILVEGEYVQSTIQRIGYEKKHIT